MTAVADCVAIPVKTLRDLLYIAETQDSDLAVKALKQEGISVNEDFVKQTIQKSWEVLSIGIDPCPFCRSRRTRIRKDAEFTTKTIVTYKVICESCQAEGPSIQALADGHDSSRAQAMVIRKWNVRGSRQP